MTKITIAEGRNKFGAIVKQAESHPVEITRRGIPVAVILSMAEYQALIGKRTSFAQAYKSFVEQHNLEGLEISDELFQRDPSPGRKIEI